CLYADEKLIATKDKGNIASVQAVITEKFRDQRPRMYCLRHGVQDSTSVYKVNHLEAWADDAKSSWGSSDQGWPASNENNKAKIISKSCCSRVWGLLYLGCGIRPYISIAAAHLSRFLKKSRREALGCSRKGGRYLLKI
ncbi:hypothetical protein GN958_ATG03661, partial [Phytophthora infestans]